MGVGVNTASPLAQLQHVLPQLSVRAIQTLLYELRAEGQACLAGTRRWAVGRWLKTRKAITGLRVVCLEPELYKITTGYKLIR